MSTWAVICANAVRLGIGSRDDVVTGSNRIEDDGGSRWLRMSWLRRTVGDAVPGTGGDTCVAQACWVCRRCRGTCHPAPSPVLVATPSKTDTENPAASTPAQLESRTCS